MKRAHVHLIGIGGIGISALAQLYVQQGYHVSGTNNGPSPQTLDRVRALGVHISQVIDVAAVPSDVDLFVYSDAWLTLEPDFMQAIRALGKPTLSYFEALGNATKEGVSIVVSGTHGKTTTTAMLAKILVDTGHDPTVVCGSIMAEYQSNFRAGRPDLFVIEGCEYRRHFLHLHPRVLLVNNIEIDHTDYFRDLADIQDAFHTLMTRIPESGTVITDTSVTTIAHILHDLRARVVPYQEVAVPVLRVPGAFNVANARAAKAAAYAYDPELREADIDRALEEFTGTWRRFEYRGKTIGGASVFDDYAHHPTAIRETLLMVRERFPGKHIVVVFHPHLFSRTRDLMNEFAEALAIADEVLLPPIYFAREAPIPGVTSEVLAEKIVAQGTRARAFGSLESVGSQLTSKHDDLGPTTVVLTMGAGDANRVADMLTGSACG